MKTIFKKGAVLTAILAVAVSVSDAQTSLTGEIRPRFEYRHGFGSPADSLQKSAQFMQQRTRLNFGYKSEKIKAGIVVQDIRVWGSQAQLNSYDVNTYGIHEAWGEYNFTKKISMKLGRQEISYDDQRIMGAVDWAQQGRSHDALLLKFTDSTFAAHFGVAYNQDNVSSIATASALGTYKEMQYLWLNKQIKKLNISLLALNVGKQSTVNVNSTRYITTAGTRIEYKANPLFLGLNFYYQMGDEMGAYSSKKAPRKVSALNAAFDAGYTIKEKFTIGLGYEYLSGQSQTDTTIAYNDVNHAFNPVFGTNHKFNGYMDYYYVGNHINTVGLQDIIFRLKYKAEKWNLALDFHQFMTAADVYDAKESAKTSSIVAKDNNLGSEIDLTFGYKLKEGVLITAGYSHYLTSETLAYIKGVKDYKGDGRTDQMSNWAYVMISFKPNFINGK
ncbi:MAG: alginate export family protein [Bacteroidia bacterium]|nr:alginate export family protein [Bacteroidia bacterium]